MDTIVQILLPGVVGATVGYLLKYYLDKRSQFITKNAEFKRDAYSDLISLMLDVMSQEQTGQKFRSNELAKKLNKAYQQCILYASPDVINAFGDFMQYLFINNAEAKQTMTYMTLVFKYMREDIGLKNNGLGDDAERLMRVKLKDYNEFFDDNINTAQMKKP